MGTNQITCNHCGRTIDEDINYCPHCRTPTPAQKERDLASIRKKLIYFIVGLSIFCAFMILWLPR